MTLYYTSVDLRALIESNIEDTRLADEIAAIIGRFDGKTITKRMATAVEKALPAYTVHYGTDCGMKRIIVWGNGVVYAARAHFLLTYDSHSQVFSFERFKAEYNAGYYGAAHKRNSKRAEQLKDLVWQSKVVDGINALNTARAALKDLVCYPAPDEHAIWKLVEDK